MKYSTFLYSSWLFILLHFFWRRTITHVAREQCHRVLLKNNSQIRHRHHHHHHHLLHTHYHLYRQLISTLFFVWPMKKIDAVIDNHKSLNYPGAIKSFPSTKIKRLLDMNWLNPLRVWLWLWRYVTFPWLISSYVLWYETTLRVFFTLVSWYETGSFASLNHVNYSSASSPSSFFRRMVFFNFVVDSTNGGKKKTKKNKQTKKKTTILN